MQAPGRWPKIETFRGDIYVYFNVNFNVLFKLTQMNLLVSELNIGLENVFFFLYIIQIWPLSYICQCNLPINVTIKTQQRNLCRFYIQALDSSIKCTPLLSLNEPSK